ncbi:NADH-quinone oxidoreductase subunit K [Methylomagnum ishizawai]|uniref:NADH-quinone oxidoreductase subunit K n=1 Tax=Methylomagnum ishizawai TaxID=1760988 RepID=A0A1Y6CX02_9GAMM|nr:NADH-quinone oxidoreductase subunit NuoK [Methylomagnum ishizawai]SMF94867.1 NADH-quinone oxidoreductase subunit K [Methylomagnum ishizawai]
MNGLVPMEHGLALSAILFALGLTGVLMRRNLIAVLMSLEIMLNAAGLAFIVAGSRWNQPDGQIMFVLVLSLAAAEIGVALGLVMRIYRTYKTLDADALSGMRG